jgi:hypothetical protein
MGSKKEMHALHRTVTPYVGQTLIYALVTLALLLFALRGGVWGPFFATPIMWALYAVTVLIALRYKILWDENSICMKASGEKDTHLKFESITEIKLERATLSEMLRASSPFRRIAIYGHGDHHVNVSLRHFRRIDIIALMSAIKARRPDLTIPAGYS